MRNYPAVFYSIQKKFLSGPFICEAQNIMVSSIFSLTYYIMRKLLIISGFGLYNVYLFLTIGGFLMCVIIETMSMMFIVPAAKCDLDLTLFEQGLLSSISFFGVVSFSYVWGFLADTRGRRGILKISLLSSFITSSLCSIVGSSWLFIVLRFINGMW